MKQIISAAFFLLSVLSVSAQTDAFRQKKFNLDNGLALKGYDPVAYITDHKAVKGTKEFATANHGVTYYFSSAANRDKFKTSPTTYEPQYGGWCAYAMGNDGSNVDVDPETFKVIDGKTFLFYNKFFNNTLKTWNKDETKLHPQADANWKKYTTAR